MLSFYSDGPPTYQSLFAVKEIKEAKESSSNQGMFAAKVVEIFCGSSKCSFDICVGAEEIRHGHSLAVKKSLYIIYKLHV